MSGREQLSRNMLIQLLSQYLLGGQQGDDDDDNDDDYENPRKVYINLVH